MNKFFKYFSVFMMLFSAVFAGLSIGNGNYLIAALNIVCIFINYSSYKSFSKIC